MLKIGERIFMASYGAGIVNDIINIKSIKGRRKYIKFFLCFDEMDLYIPVERIKNYKIREITSKDELEEIIVKLYKEPEDIQTKWKKRYKKNLKILKNNNIIDILGVLRELYYLSNNDLIPEGEKKILYRAEGIVASEIMFAYNITMEEAYAKLRNKD